MNLDEMELHIRKSYPIATLPSEVALALIERVRKLERVAEAARILADHTNRDYSEWREPVYKALADLEDE